IIVTSELIDFEKYCAPAVYYVAARLCRFYQFAKEYSGFDSYVMLDADLIINGSLDEVLYGQPQRPAFIYFRDEPLWDSLMGGFCFIPKDNLENLLVWISNFVLRTIKSGRAVWFLDIVAIFFAVEKFEARGGVIKCLEPDVYCDLNHCSGSSIWAVTNNKNAFLYNAKNQFYFEQFVERSGMDMRDIYAPSAIAGMDAYWVRNLIVDKAFINVNRNAFFAEMCVGKKVLHVGCADYPITNIDNNLHVYLDKICDIDGCDTQEEGLAMLRDHVAGRLFSSLSHADAAYDLVLVPEVIEHVDNVSNFLNELDKVNFRYVVITVPDAYLCSKTHFHNQANGNAVVELNHPDHNCWYSPYTISNVIKKYTSWRILKLAFFDQRSIMLVAEKSIVAH